MDPLRVLEQIARRRMPHEERVRLESFVADIDDTWTSAGRQGPSLQVRSRLVLLWSSATCGGPTLLSAGVGALIAAAGSAVLALSSVPNTAAYETSVPTMIQLGLTAAIVLLAISCLGWPRTMRALVAGLVGASFAASGVGAAATFHAYNRWDGLLVVSLWVVALSGVLLLVGAAVSRARWVLAGLRALGLAALMVMASDGAWTFLYLADRDGVRAGGCLLSAVGAVLIASALLAARPSITMRSA